MVQGSVIVRKSTYEMALGSPIVRKFAHEMVPGSSIARKFTYKMAFEEPIVRKFTYKMAQGAPLYVNLRVSARLGCISQDAPSQDVPGTRKRKPKNFTRARHMAYKAKWLFSIPERGGYFREAV